MSQIPLKEHQHITLLSAFVDAPLTLPPTDEKVFAQVPRVVALFKDIQAGRHIKKRPWTEFQLAQGECGGLERRLEQDESLLGYVKDKIRYVGSGNDRVPSNDGRSHRLVVHKPTAIHELFIHGVEDAIRCQLKTIRDRSHKAALFA
jgi:hypothetical protein